ncbi:MAG TPA: tail fiber domain-containing protein, partial [Saprospiraceae bacterium]|nr:tail fiber domain-containing protein [Saprospiraceae bacterium]
GAGDLSTTASSNTFIGRSAGGSNTTGAFNVFSGAEAGSINVSGNDNIFIGYEAGANNNDGNQNVFIGTRAGFVNTVDRNTFVGYYAGTSNTTGLRSVFMGYQSGKAQTTGVNNTFIGYEAGTATTIAHDNTCLGYSAGWSNITGDANTLVGSFAGSNLTSQNNTLVGAYAGGQLITGNFNTFIGQGAGGSVTLGQHDTALGDGSGFSSPGIDDASAIGYTTLCNADNKVRIGNSSITVIEGQVDWTFPSDGRFKYNIQDLSVSGLDFIKKLRPVTYQFDRRKYEEHIMQELPDSVRAKRLASMEFNPSEEKTQTGFIAQEVEQTCKDLNYTFSGLHVPENKTDNYGIAYGSFVPVLVKAMQEQQAQIEEMKEIIQGLKAEVSALSPYPLMPSQK